MSHPVIGSGRTWYLVVPSLKISGGIREVLRLGEDFAKQGCRAALVCMWKSTHATASRLYVHELSDWLATPARAAFDLPLLLCRFLKLVRFQLRSAVDTSAGFIFTHYATLPLSMVVPRRCRFFFVQDLEWKFVRSTLWSRALRSAILYFYRRGKLISANSYLTAALRELRLPVLVEAPIWADPEFSADHSGVRDIDYVMVLRKGAHKRLDLYLAFIRIAKRHTNLRVAVISTEDEIVSALRDDAAVCLLRPPLLQMRSLYMRSKCFVHLSEHEGFGLPPLEAMGAGCVPLCRDSGGVRAFMASETFASLLLPLDMSIEHIFTRGQTLICDEARWRVLSEAARRVFREGLSTAAQRASNIERIVNAESEREGD